MDFDVIIVGGGPVGAGLARALTGKGLAIALVEAHVPQFGDDAWDSRIYAVSPGSAKFLRDCSAWDDDLARLTRVEEMRIFGDDPRAELNFDAYGAGLRELAFIIENRELQRMLWSALRQQADLEIFAPAGCAALNLDGDAAQLTLADGATLKAQLIVAADGVDSWVRAQTSIRTKTREYRQKAIVANFSTAQHHREIAFQWFTRDSVLAFLPLPGNHVSMVYSCDELEGERLLDMASADVELFINSVSRGALGELKLISPPLSFVLRLQQVSRLVLPRLALVGDAGHAVHPLAGQGINLGFRDARILATVLAGRGAQRDCGDFHLLRRYERGRQEDILLMRLMTDGLQRLFSHPNAWVQAARNMGLRLVDRQAVLKNLLVRHAVA